MKFKAPTVSTSQKSNYKRLTQANILHLELKYAYYTHSMQAIPWIYHFMLLLTDAYILPADCLLYS